jgi:hypothetical protein
MRCSSAIGFTGNYKVYLKDIVEFNGYIPNNREHLKLLKAYVILRLGKSLLS